MSNNDSSEDLQVNTRGVIKEIIDGLAELRKEIEFAKSSLDSKAIETTDKFNNSFVVFEQYSQKLESTFKKQKEANQDFEKKIGVLTLLPEKLATCTKGIVPDIAEALKIKVMQNIENIKQLFDALNQEMALRVYEQQERVSETTKELIKEASLSSRNNRRGLLISIMISAVFAAGISAVTSYLINTKYPRFVEITDAHNINVQDSNVKVWRQVKDIEGTRKKK